MIVTINPQTVSVSVRSDSLDIGFGNPVARDLVERDPYTGAYAVTPGEETITLATDGKRMTDNITINPIPSNYGRITKVGSYIRIW